MLTISALTVQVNPEAVVLSGAVAAHGSADAALDKTAAAATPSAADCARIAATFKRFLIRGSLVTDLVITKTPIDQYRSKVSFVHLKKLGRAPRGNGRYVSKELRDSIPRQITGYEYQSRPPVAVRPILEFDRRVDHMLHELDDDRPAAFLDRDEAFDP